MCRGCVGMCVGVVYVFVCMCVGVVYGCVYGLCMCVGVV